MAQQSSPQRADLHPCAFSEEEAQERFHSLAEAIGCQLCVSLGVAGADPRGSPRPVWGKEHQNIAEGALGLFPFLQS